jgi:hypothetical protein
MLRNNVVADFWAECHSRDVTDTIRRNVRLNSWLRKSRTPCSRHSSAAYDSESLNASVQQVIPRSRKQIRNVVIPALAEHRRLYDVNFKLRLLARLEGQNSRRGILIAADEAGYARECGAVLEPCQQLVGSNPDAGFYGLAAHLVQIVYAVSGLCITACLAMVHPHSRPGIGFFQRDEISYFPGAVIAEDDCGVGRKKTLLQPLENRHCVTGARLFAHSRVNWRAARAAALGMAARPQSRNASCRAAARAHIERAPRKNPLHAQAQLRWQLQHTRRTLNVGRPAPAIPSTQDLYVFRKSSARPA